MLITRFAPSPTGRLHLGHAYSAALANEAARDASGHFLLRFEDLDQTRSRPEFVTAIEDDLRWLGMDWDGEPFVQSLRSTAYADALEKLKRRGLIYPCFCTRSDIAAALNAPHGPTESRYPGTCRGMPDDPERRSITPHSWRLDAGKAIERVGLPSWNEQGGRTYSAAAAEIDDEILARKDAPASYHLACVVDDAEPASRSSFGAPTCDLRLQCSGCCRCCSGCPSRAISITRWWCMMTGGVWQSATWRPRLRRSAKAASRVANLRAGSRGVLPSGFRLSDA
jgi:hypothetical protein